MAKIKVKPGWEGTAFQWRAEVLGLQYKLDEYEKLKAGESVEVDADVADKMVKTNYFITIKEEPKKKEKEGDQ